MFEEGCVFRDNKDVSEESVITEKGPARVKNTPAASNNDTAV